MERATWMTMEGSVSPLAQVKSGQNAALARNTWVDFMIRQDHGVDLNGVDVIAVVAEDAGHLDFADFAQLLERETAGPTAVFVPKTIAGSEVAKLFANNAGKSGAHHGSGQGLFGHAGRPQIDIVRRFVVLFVAFDGQVAHDAVQVVEGSNTLEAAELAPFVVGRYTVFSTSLNVERGQIQAPFLTGLLEQVICDLLSYRIVESLSDL